MPHENADCFSLDLWSQLMGRDLPKSDRQAIQPVMVEDGKATLSADTLKSCFSPGAKVGFRLGGGHIALEETPDGVLVEDEGRHELELSAATRDVLPNEEPLFAMVVGQDKRLELMPIRVEEHRPDVLGPRMIDEVREAPDRARPPTLVRHLVRGFEYADWTAQRVQELEDVVCSEPFPHDPLEPLATGDDWIAWQTRNRVLRQPDPGDGEVRQALMAGIFAGQVEDGSWEGSVVKTAYGILRALSIDVCADDGKIQRAADWLLRWPEPAGRPGWWALNDEYLAKWNARQAGEDIGEFDFMNRGFLDEEHDLFRQPEQQEIVASCSRHHAAPCDSLHHPSTVAAEALCRCGHADDPRLRSYAATMLDLHAMFGYFCACWGILNKERDMESLRGKEPDFDHSPDQYETALKAMPYGYARDAADLQALARHPSYPGVHRPDLADTNWQPPYEWRDIGVDGHAALVGSYWENADCWAKANRALSQFPPWSGSAAEFFALFQCHLYQTPLGEWHQAFPAGIFRWIAEVTRTTRARQTIEDSQLLRFAKVVLLKSIPWLRVRQKDDGLWDHEELSRFNDKNRPPSRRLGTYHIVSALAEFGLLDRMSPPDA